MTDARELLSSHEIGRARAVDVSGTRSLNEVVFDNDLLPFMPKEAMLFDFFTGTEKYFLLWKIDSEEERVPDFEEAKDDVEHAWKLAQATNLAQEKAVQIASDVNDSGTTLQDFDAEVNQRMQ